MGVSQCGTLSLWQYCFENVGALRDGGAKNTAVTPPVCWGRAPDVAALRLVGHE